MILALLMSCLGPAASTDPAAMVEALHQDFAEHYALFPVKPEVDWDAQLDAVPALGAGASDAELFDALTGLMGPLNDNHVHLLVPLSEGGEAFEDWTSGALHELERDDADIEVTLALLDSSAQPHPRLAWGQLGEVGYVWVGSESSDDLLPHLDEALAALEGVDALVLDLRHNGGGYTDVTQAIAARFMDGDVRYGARRLRASPTPGDFTEWVDLRVAPNEGPVWDGPVAVAQHRFTVSAAEGLLMALSERPETTFVGEVSSGAFGTVWWRELPNGWLYSITVSDERDADLVSWEGVGMPVDVEAKSTLEELRDGEDKALEAALEVLGR